MKNSSQVLTLKMIDSKLLSGFKGILYINGTGTTILKLARASALAIRALFNRVTHIRANIGMMTCKTNISFYLLLRVRSSLQRAIFWYFVFLVVSSFISFWFSASVFSHPETGLAGSVWTVGVLEFLNLLDII